MTQDHQGSPVKAALTLVSTRGEVGCRRVLTERWVGGVKSNPIFKNSTKLAAFVDIKHIHTEMSEENQVYIAVIGKLNDEAF